MRGSSVGARGTASSTGLPWASWSPGWCSTRIPRRSRPSFGSPVSRRSVPEQLEWDFERFKREWPRDLAAHVREAYRIDLTARYLGEALPHPIGKGSGQLSLNAGQLEDDASAGLAFVVLKTLIADDRAQILRWLGEVPHRIRAASPLPVKVAVKLMNARFDDTFQVEMMQATRDADALVCFNRLFDTQRDVAYGGWDLSDRNLRVLNFYRPLPTSTDRYRLLVGTGNICSGRMILEYASRGCESVQLHTFFQLPLAEYPATYGSRSQRALHALVFHPEHGLIAGMRDLEARGTLDRRNGELHFLDVSSHAHRAS